MCTTVLLGHFGTFLKGLADRVQRKPSLGCLEVEPRPGAAGMIWSWRLLPCEVSQTAAGVASIMG